jgi:hypothetical protein
VDETRENECVKTHAESRRCLAKASHSALVEGEASRHLPSGNVFWIFTVAGAVSVADLEDRADGATVLASCSLEADVVFAAVVGMGMAGERSRVAHFSGGGTGEASGDFCKRTSERHSLSNSDSKNYLRSCILGLDRPTCRRGPRGRRPVRGSTGTWRLHRSNSSRRRRICPRRRKCRTGARSEWRRSVALQRTRQAPHIETHRGLTELRPVAAVHVVDVVAVLGEEFGVAGVEGEPVPASLQLGDVVVALPVFVAGAVVWVEAEIIGTFEVLLGEGCKTNLLQIGQER